MQQMSMMDFFMPCWNSAMLMSDAWKLCKRGTQILLRASLLLLSLGIGLAHAENPVQLEELVLQRSEEGIYLSTRLGFELPQSLEDALSRGLPLGFVMQSDVMKERWYWSDKLVSRTERFVRLSFQPLSKRWRVYVSAQPIQSTGLGVSLGQSFESLSEALLSIQRISRWRIADASVIDIANKQRLEFRFKLDLSQLPQPLQFGVLGGGSGLEYTQSMKLQEDSFK
jgi:hypothetical protein